MFDISLIKLEPIGPQMKMPGCNAKYIQTTYDLYKTPNLNAIRYALPHCD